MSYILCNHISENDISDNDILDNDILDNDILDNDILDNDTSDNDISDNDTSDNDTSDNDTSSDNNEKNEIISQDFQELIKEYTEPFIHVYNKLKSDLYDIDWLDNNYSNHKFTIRSVVILILLLSFSTMFHSVRIERHETNIYDMNDSLSQHKKMLLDHHESIHQLLKYNFIKQSESCQYKFTSPSYVPTPDPIKRESNHN